MKQHIFTKFGLTLCCLDTNEVQGQKGDVCSQCSHIAVMLLSGEQQFYEAIEAKAIKRQEK